VQLDHGATNLGMQRNLGITYGFFRFYEANLRTVESAAMYNSMSLTLTGAGDPLRVTVLRVTPSIAAVLGTPPAAGRWFTYAEGGPGEPQTVMLSHAFWRDRFGADPTVIGRTIVLSDVSYEVVGVMSASLTAPFAGPVLFVPREVASTGTGGWNDMAVGRMEDGADAADVEREMLSLLPRLRATADNPEQVRSYLDDAGVFPTVRSLKESVVGDVRATLWIMLGTVSLVLLIAVANVTNLFLVRNEENQRASAVRAALGAGRLRIARALLAETALLTGSAFVVGVFAATAAVRVLRDRTPMNIPRLDEVRLGGVSIGMAALVCLLAAVLLGLVPALRQSRDLAETLKDNSGRTTAGRRRLRGRSALVSTQVALALILLVGSGLLLRTFQGLRSVDVGFSERSALTFQVGLAPAAYDRAAAIRFHDALLQRLESIPGVESAAMVGQCLPLSGTMCWGETLMVEGRPVVEGESPIVTGVRAVSPEYFGTLGIPLQGRGIQAGEASSGAPEAILSESAARAHFTGEDPVGHRVALGGPDPVWFTVVAVAGDVRSRVAGDDFTSLIYLPVLPGITQGPPPHEVAYAVKTVVPPASITQAARAAVAELDANVPIANVRTLDEMIATATAPAAFALTLVGLAALLSLLLGAVGVYAVVAYSVSRRTSEIGLRMALGAQAVDVRRMVVRQGGVSVVLGATIGLAGAFALTRLMESMLFEVSATDPVTFGTVTALMLGVAGMAMWLPARRAARVDPVEALRGE
jgi:predicted permease